MCLFCQCNGKEAEKCTAAIKQKINREETKDVVPNQTNGEGSAEPEHPKRSTSHQRGGAGVQNA
jgi:hypothetical protein